MDSGVGEAPIAIWRAVSGNLLMVKTDATSQTSGGLWLVVDSQRKRRNPPALAQPFLGSRARYHGRVASKRCEVHFRGQDHAFD